MRVAIHSLSLLAALALAACGGAGTSATTPAGSSGPTAAAPAAFKAMNHDQQLNHMKTVIQPTMGAIFKAADAKRYAEFGCATCHGEKKEDPHKALPKLTLSGDGFAKLKAEKPEVMKFMSEQVTPAMAKAMGEPAYDPQTHKGFGCGGCHTVQ